VDLAVHAPLRSQHLDGNLPEALTTEPTRQSVDPKLRGEAERCGEFAKEVLVALRTLLELIGKRTQAISLLALLLDANTE
jgi:hypothetical protein